MLRAYFLNDCKQNLCALLYFQGKITVEPPVSGHRSLLTGGGRLREVRPQGVYILNHACCRLRVLIHAQIHP